ncbi:MAG: N-6 DNA methylase [Pirellulaceae bacterium]|nr:N-6 DNA methylase [Pirellulaceae bacterium]
MAAAHRYSSPLHEPVLPRAQRRATGVYYTPPEVVRDIVALTLEPLAEARPRLLDPACGAGAFLVAACRFLVGRLQSRGEPLDEAARLSLAQDTLFGVDIDDAAVCAARLTVAREVAGGDATPERIERLAARLAENIWTADALADDQLSAQAPFDAVLGNPPYVNIRELAKSRSAEELAGLRGRFRTARGSFDLYGLFVERVHELLRIGGRCGMIVPNKWAALDYAQPLRELLAREATVEHVLDLADARVFRRVAVYPQMLVFRKTSPVAETIPWTCADSMAVESRVPTIPLGQLARLSCGTAGFAATKIANRLIDEGESPDSPPESAEFITSGNIDRYAIRLGNVRYLGRNYTRPRLPLAGPGLSRRKLNLIREPKIVIAGLARRIEAAWDAAGLALGVQVFAVSESCVDPRYLLAVLNSKLLSYLFSTRFAAKRLAGRYLAFNKGQLARLPIAIAGTTDADSPAAEIAATLAVLAERQSKAHAPALDDEIDRLVVRLYGLTDAEVAEVESHFTHSVAKAA